jgi:hypothetical protein
LTTCAATGAAAAEANPECEHRLRSPIGGGDRSTILLFDSLGAVRRFAGDDYEAAYVPPEARAVLSDFDATSVHYEVLLSPPLAA